MAFLPCCFKDSHAYQDMANPQTEESYPESPESMGAAVLAHGFPLPRQSRGQSLKGRRKFLSSKGFSSPAWANTTQLCGDGQMPVGLLQRYPRHYHHSAH